MTQENEKQNPVADEIESMLDTLEPVEELEEESVEEPVDEGGDKEKVEEPSKKEAEEDDAEEKEEPEKVEEDSELTLLKQSNAELSRTVKDLAKRVSEKEVEEAPKFELEASEFIATDEEYDTVMHSKEGLNQLLHKAVSYGADKAIEHVNLGIPKLVQDEAMRVVDQAVTIKLFFRDNQDLLRLGDANQSAHQKIAAVYRQLEERHPNSNVDQLMSMLADATRKAYGVKQKGKKGKTPPFAQAGGKAVRGVQKQKANVIGDEIEKMGKI